MDDGMALIARASSRRTFLAASAAGTAAFMLAACGSSATTPTNTTAPLAAPATNGPLPTVTPVPQSLGNTAVAGSATTGMAAGGMPTTSVQPTMAANVADKQVFRYSDIEPPSFDPQVGSSPYNMPQAFVGLVEVDWTNNQIVPGIAQSYQANADATQWTFKLRPGMKWSDGTPLTASAFVYAIQRIADPKVASNYSVAIATIKNGLEAVAGKVPVDQVGVSAPDDSTVVFALNTPIPFFPLIAATWPYFPAPKHVIDKFGDKWTEASNIVSNGPYKMVDWKHTQVQVFEINPNYFGTKPIVTRVECTIYPDDSFLQKGLAAYRNNELDTAMIAPADFAFVQKDAQLSKELKAFPGSSTNMIHFDTTNPPTDKVEVRQALALGFDRQALTDIVLQKYYLDAPTLVPTDIPGANPAAALTGGVDKAKQLLMQGGYPNGQGWPQDFKIVYASSDATKLILEFLQSEWKKNLGVTVNLQAMDTKATIAYRVARKDQPYNGLVGSQSSNYSDAYYWHNFLFSSKNDYWPTHWHDDMYESLIGKAAGLTDNVARAKLYEQAEVILMQAANHLPLYHVRSFFLIKPNLQGSYHAPILGTVPRAKYAYFTK